MEAYTGKTAHSCCVHTATLVGFSQSAREDLLLLSLEKDSKSGTRMATKKTKNERRTLAEDDEDGG